MDTSVKGAVLEKKTLLSQCNDIIALLPVSINSIFVVRGFEYVMGIEK